MGSLLGFVHFLSLAIWVGGLFFFFLVVAPTVYRFLSDDLARSLGHQLLTAYYVLASGCGVGALVSLLAVVTLQGQVGWFWLRTALILAMTLLTVNAAWVVQPRIDKIINAVADYEPRNDKESQAIMLRRLQRLSLQLNGVVLLLGLTTLWLSVGGPRLSL